MTAEVSNPNFTGANPDDVGNSDYDVAILFLDKPVTDIAPAPIGTESDWGTEYASTGCGVNRDQACAEAYAMGWGHYNYDHAHPVYPAWLQAGAFTLGSDDSCKSLVDGPNGMTRPPSSARSTRRGIRASRMATVVGRWRYLPQRVGADRRYEPLPVAATPMGQLPRRHERDRGNLGGWTNDPKLDRSPNEPSVSRGKNERERMADARERRPGFSASQPGPGAFRPHGSGERQ